MQRLADETSAVWDGTAVLDLGPRGLKPGDALHVKIVAVDNSPWAQRGESRELLLKIPTMEERRTIARDARRFGGESGAFDGGGGEVARAADERRGARSQAAQPPDAQSNASGNGEDQKAR